MAPVPSPVDVPDTVMLLPSRAPVMTTDGPASARGTTAFDGWAPGDIIGVPTTVSCSIDFIEAVQGRLTCMINHDVDQIRVRVVDPQNLTA
jgi:hypothetical protein